MKATGSQKRSSIIRNIRNSRGFSLIEMAIVLVIIGVIIGAIVKGQDLILNARAKQVTSAVSTWRNLSMAYLDRNGRLPGDGGKTGIIQPFAGYSSATKEIQRSMTTAPANPLTVGSLNFYIYIGNTTDTTAGRNIIAICKDADCLTEFTSDELEIIKAVDTSFDGVADAGVGQFRGAPTVTYATGYITLATPADVSTSGTTADWLPATGYKTAILAFDRPF